MTGARAASAVSERPAPVSARDRFNDFVARHDVAWELGMAGLAIVYVALGFAVDQVPQGARPDLELAELGLTGVFVLEFMTRIGAARDRFRYLRYHLVDLVALAPPIRAARVLRLLRLLRLVRAFSGLYRAGLHLGGIARHRGFAWLVAAWLAVMAVCSVGLYAAEHGVNETIASPFDALWWGVVTLSTVGYGDVVPRTPEGRIAAMALMLLGIGMFSAITATITSYLLSTSAGRDVTPGGMVVDELERLAQLRDHGSLTDEEYTAAKRRLLGA